MDADHITAIFQHVCNFVSAQASFNANKEMKSLLVTVSAALHVV